MDICVAIWDLSDLEEIVEAQMEQKYPRVRASPKYITKYLHKNYVDSASFLGDWILSKSISNFIILWKPHYHETSILSYLKRMGFFTYFCGTF